MIENYVQWRMQIHSQKSKKSGKAAPLRIADCAAQHSTKPAWDAGGAGKLSWNGSVNGNSGEGSWTLVSVYKRGAAAGSTCDSTCTELWRDDRTGLVWSDHLGDANWCKAAGASNRVGSPYAEDDPSNICDSATNQSQTAPVSLCYEDSTWLSTPTGLTDGSTFEYDNAKVGLRASTTPSVDWRLPTIEDWRLANINGVRHVLPNMGRGFWSASVDSSYRDSAWLFHGGYGSIYHSYYVIRDSSFYSVRCVGR
jgi:hypothetical protein